MTGGGQEFVRAYSARAYGIAPEQVVGSSVATKYEDPGAAPVLMREPKVFFVDDHAGKPIGINLFIGKRPSAAFGNSDGDREMLEYATAGNGPRFGMLVLHDDKVREYAYGPAASMPDTKVGTFPQSLMDDARLGRGLHEERLEAYLLLRAAGSLAPTGAARLASRLVDALRGGSQPRPTNGRLSS